jgi:hypothetical protein
MAYNFIQGCGSRSTNLAAGSGSALKLKMEPYRAVDAQNESFEESPRESVDHRS